MRLLLQLLAIAAIGTTLGALHGIFRGFPTSSTLEADATCEAPIAQNDLVHWISAEEAVDAYSRKAATFIDARSEARYVSGHIAQAVRREAAIVQEPTLSFSADHMIVVYDDRSDDCRKAKQLSSELIKRGFRDVRVLQGGMEAWNEAKYPAQSGSTP